MKKLFTLFALVLCLTNLKAQFVTIPDANFVTWLQANVPSAMSGNQMDTTSLAVTTRTNVNVYNNSIGDVYGIQYFDSLKKLNCSYNQLTNLSNLPSSLLYLDCGYNQLPNLPALPNSVNYLDCSGNQLVNLPILPSSITLLYCGSNQLISLPAMPNSLITIDCSYNPYIAITILPNSLFSLFCRNNQLSNLPLLPNSIEYLDCSDNQLTNLPVLSSSTRTLNCSDNLLTSLPLLPDSLKWLFCTNNQLTSLPALPTNLKLLHCYNNNNISCFPVFPNMPDITNGPAPILELSINPNPFSCLPNYIATMDYNTLNYPLCVLGNSLTNPNGCSTAKGITGALFYDSNSDCAINIGETGIKNEIVKIYNNSNTFLRLTNTNNNGQYFFNDTSGVYDITIDTINKPYSMQCSIPGIDSLVTLSTSNVFVDSVNFQLICKPGFDVGVQSINTTGIVFPGQNHILNVNAGDISHWYNLNCAAGTSGTLSFSVNGSVTYMGPALGSLTPSVAGNIYTYNIADFGTINNTTDFQLLFQTNTTAQAGDVICVNATVTPISGDNNPNNNILTFCYNVVNSYDPNIKETYPENVQPGFNDWLTYTIHFQNTGNAPAFNIRLADTLDTMLDLETFQVINYSHQNLVDLTGNVLNVRFPNIQLPDSTTNSAGSIGFIQYRIKPKATWIAPYQIKNTCYIYFDYNAPIVTNTTLNSILVPTGLNNQIETVMNLYPNPSNGSFTIELNTKQKQSIQVFDITGNVVLSHTIENGKAIIDASNLAAGIYNINIKGINGVANKKLVIVK